jgi:hypothetical protein
LAFAELLSQEMRGLGESHAVSFIEIRVEAARIGASSDNVSVSSIARELAGVVEWDGNSARRLFLLLARCAREKSDHGAVRDLFSREADVDLLWKQALSVPRAQTLETVDIEAVSMSLSYREAADLRWALDIARQELPDQGAEPRRSTPFRRPRKH